MKTAPATIHFLIFRPPFFTCSNILIVTAAWLSVAVAADPDDYNQWKLALGTNAAADPAELEVAEGFAVDLLRSAGRDEGSWISLEFDEAGRIYVGREERGILRITPPVEEGGEPLVETVDDTLEEPRGLLWAYGSLYVNANNSKGLYRLRDRDGDDRFDEVTLLKSTGGGVGHGRNDLALGPDGFIYSIHGNDVRLPLGFTPGESPYRNYAEDRILPCAWDRLLFNAGIQPPAGHVVRTDRDGRRWEIVAGGFRNPFGLDFSPQGELFTYDADMEWDAGAPWYRPTRVCHVVSGGEYGWRQGTGKQPEWMPGSLPPVVNIGLGSPTGVKFGTNSNFPERYREALFILDWAYGRIIAVHLTPDGASYRGEAEAFVRGRPLNVTDLGFGPDGAMYFVTGGRKTQSGLYRVRFAPDEDSPPPFSPPPEDAFAALQRGVRRDLERFHGKTDPQAVHTAWDYLQSGDRFIRLAARVAIERQPVESWRERALSEDHPPAAGTALLALARAGGKDLQPRWLARFEVLPIEDFSADDEAIALRALEVCFARMGPPPADCEQPLAARLAEMYPSGSPHVDYLLCELLVYLRSPLVVEKTIPLLDAAETTEQKLHYLFTLREVDFGWTTDARIRYFTWLRRAEEFEGAQYLPKFLHHIRSDAVATLTAEEKKRLAPLLAETSGKDGSPLDSPDRPFVRKWSLEDLADDLTTLGNERSFERGKQMFAVARCDRCHRLAGEGTAIGPDLEGVSRRFGRGDLLVSISEPSKAVGDKYRMATVVHDDGRVLVGQVLSDDGETLRLATDPYHSDSVLEIAAADIDSRLAADLSPMPAGLIDTLTKEELLDLLAYLEADGREDAAIYQGE